MEPSAVLREVRGGVELDIMVTPNAKASSIEGVDPWRKRLVVKVQAVPSEGRANRAVCDLFSEVFSTKAEIVHGQADRHKTIFLPLNKEEALRRLEGAHAGR